jgi:hypothetical protein
MSAPTIAFRPTRANTAESWIVAVVPFLTLGFFTWAAFGYAAARVRSWLFGGAAIGYLVTMIVFCAVIMSVPEDTGKPSPQRTILDVIGIVLLLMMWPAGTLHALLLRQRFAHELAGQAASGAMSVPIPEPVQRSSAVDPAVAAALARRQRRAQAMAIVQNDPRLANELRIGRPDLPRQYDDGGLIDVNQVPAAVLAALPGITPELAAAVVAAREHTGGLTGPDDLVVFADAPPEVVSGVAEFLLFRPVGT